MQYPTMNRNASRAVAVPAMTGGVNLSDPLNLVDDNQMTDMKNLWYDNGVLKTRPALVNHIGLYENLLNGNAITYSTELNQFVDGEKYKLFVLKDKKSNGSGTLMLVAFSGENKRFTIETEFSTLPEKELLFAGKNSLENGIGIYLLASFASGLVYLYEITEEYKLTRLEADDLYAPAIYINGKGNEYSTLPSTGDTESIAPASFLEGYNAISNAWARYYYTSDGVSYDFTIPTEIMNHVIYAEVSDGNDKLTFGPANVTDWSQTIRCNEDNKFSIFINCGIKMIILNSGGDTSRYVVSSALNGNGNNIVFYLRPINPDPSIINGVTFGEWFGGSSEGISGGTRFFASGSETNKNLIVWSDLNEPTYFPENNYAYVGESSQRITALKKQSDMLVIFKENELFYTTYVAGDEYTATDVVNGNIIDIVANSAYFPMVQIHADTGCDIPKSIQLCGDKLVWACKDRHVYMLQSANQYSTANISRISASVDKALAEISNTEIESTKSCIYKGHYILSFEAKTFVLDYDSYYFKNLPAYSDNQNRQRKLVWYIWEIPGMSGYKYSEYISTNDECYVAFFYNFENSDGKGVGLFCRKMDENSGVDAYYGKIHSVMQTKMFDFGISSQFKKIEQVYIGLGNMDGHTSIEYVTDRGNRFGGYIDIPDTESEFDPKYISVKRLLPMVNRALRFGIRLECDGRIAIDGITIKYKPMGVVR